MTHYYRLMLGEKSIHSETCFNNNFVGTDFEIHEDLTEKLPDDWREFNKTFIPVFLNNHPDKTKIGAGLACGALWTVSKGLRKGDIVLCPDGTGVYRLGEITGDYYYEREGILPHRRPVQWHSKTIERSNMSEPLRKSTGSSGTIADITGYTNEIKTLLDSGLSRGCSLDEEIIENPTSFALEKHLEHFLVENWELTDLGKNYDIYQENGEKIGQQYLTDTGPLDILAIKKDNSEILVVELKKGRASDIVVGQILRYMGYVKEELAESSQNVRGVIIALEDCKRLKRALAVSTNIDFLRYQINFSLQKG